MSRPALSLAIGLAALPLLVAACTSSPPDSTPRESAGAAPAPRSEARAGDAADADAFGDWRPLFDGRTLAGWRGFRSAEPAGWQAVDGALARVGAGGDIMTVETFDDFELALEWKVAPGGNSGVMYRVAPDGPATYETGPEMQVLDDAGHADGRSPLTSAGSAFGLYPAAPGAVRPAGEWNAARLVVRGAHVEHWLNETKVAEYEIASPDWEQRVRGSKFAAWPRFGRVPRGHIALQDHGDRVEYRNVRIRTPR